MPARLVTPVLSAALLLAASPAGALAQEADTRTILTSAGQVTIETLADLTHPWGMEVMPDGALLVSEKIGNLRIYRADGTLSDPISGVPEVEFLDQGGLLDVVLAPDFADTNEVFFYYVEAAERQPDMERLEGDPRLGPYVNEQDTTRKGGAVARAVLAGDALEDVEVIWRQTPKTIGLGHFGGRLLFLDDGTLLITSGERQRFDGAQREDQNLGKLIRIARDGSVPDDNPHAGEGAPMNAVWAMGVRNPLGIARRPETGDVWYHEMGPLHGDELSKVERGANYGWPEVSNGENYDRSPLPHHETALEAYRQPDYYWHPAVSPSGLAFYDGGAFPDWQGDALVGALSAETLVRVVFDGDDVSMEERLPVAMRVRDVTTGPDGAILILRDGENGALMRLAPAEPASAE